MTTASVTLTAEERLDIVVSLRIRAHELRTAAKHDAGLAQFRDGDIAEANRLEALASMLEGKHVTVWRISRPGEYAR